MEQAYLKETIGEALTEGCSAAAIALPTDPVEYLGLWLLKYVENAKIRTETADELLVEQQVEDARKAAEAEEAKKLAAIQHQRVNSIQKLMLFSQDPYELFHEACQTIVAQTGATSAYVATIELPLKDLPEVPDDSDAEGEGEGGDEEGEGEAAEPEAGADEEEEGEKEEDDEKPKFDYSQSVMYYVAASENQKFMLDKSLIREPIVYGEDEEPPEEDEDGNPPPTHKNQGITFAIPDEGLNAIDVPNILYKPDMHYFKSFPRLGAYFASAVKIASGELRAIIAADTMIPEGKGAKLSEEDKDFIMEVSRTMRLALDKAEEGRLKIVETEAAKTLAQELDLELNPPPPELAEGEEPPPPEEAPPPEEEDEPDEPEPEPEEEAPAEEGEEGEEGEPVEPPPLTVEEAQAILEKCNMALTKCEKKVRKAERVLNKCTQETEKEKAKHELCVAKVDGCQAQAIEELRLQFRTCPNTFRLVQAALWILGKDPKTFDDWKKCRLYIQPEFFASLVKFDATADRVKEHWKAVRACLKEPTAEALQSEAILGDLLRVYILQTKKLAKAAAAQRAAEASLKECNENVETAKSEIQKAEAEVTAAEERKAAEEAAAAEAEAAAAAAEAEGGEEAAEEG